jgi:hypothetical protein
MPLVTMRTSGIIASFFPSPEFYRDIAHFLTDHSRVLPPCCPAELGQSKSKFETGKRAESGLFVLAEVTIRFIKDPIFADPVTRLDLVSSTINRLNVFPSDSQPFAFLYALHTNILGCIPSDMQPIYYPGREIFLSFLDLGFCSIHASTQRFVIMCSG